jgi:hypothetical protein
MEVTLLWMCSTSPFEELAPLRLVCKRWKTLVDESPLSMCLAETRELSKLCASSIIRCCSDMVARMGSSTEEEEEEEPPIAEDCVQRLRYLADTVTRVVAFLNFRRTVACPNSRELLQMLVRLEKQLDVTEDAIAELICWN